MKAYLVSQLNRIGGPGGSRAFTRGTFINIEE